ncbi:YbaK/EbsC family protein [Granulicoccus sp. GXG6511]|uniref:YbaK/EbsC family protein n=1 Tax=Granulicoccus sp. GXG6511 TaxID=3381351 RepID=UPI003D7E0E5E
MSTGPGNLDWQPALDHPELVAPPTADALVQLGQTSDVRALVAPIDPSLADTAEFCAAYGVGMAESANCVVVEGRRGDVTKMAAIMILATDRADVNKVVRKHLDARKMSFASMETATTLTGMEYGGITPVGLPSDWPILIDRGVADAGLVVIGSGLRGSKIAIDAAALAELPNAEVLDLAIKS